MAVSLSGKGLHCLLSTMPSLEKRILKVFLGLGTVRNVVRLGRQDVLGATHLYLAACI
jgi:hypothetical protein